MLNHAKWTVVPFHSISVVPKSEKVTQMDQWLMVRPCYACVMEDHGRCDCLLLCHTITQAAHLFYSSSNQALKQLVSTFKTMSTNLHTAFRIYDEKVETLGLECFWNAARTQGLNARQASHLCMSQAWGMAKAAAFFGVRHRVSLHNLSCQIQAL